MPMYDMIWSFIVFMNSICIYIEIDDGMQTRKSDDKDYKYSDIQITSNIYWMIDDNSLLPANDSKRFDQWIPNLNDFNLISHIQYSQRNGCARIPSKIRLAEM